MLIGGWVAKALSQFQVSIVGESRSELIHFYRRCTSRPAMLEAELGEIDPAIGLRRVDLGGVGPSPAANGPRLTPVNDGQSRSTPVNGGQRRSTASQRLN